MSDFFRSVERPFENTLASKRKDQSNFLGALVVIFGFAIAFSVLPLIPAIMYLVVPRLTRAPSFALIGLTVPLNSFKLWWPVCVVVFIIVEWATVSLSNSRSRARKKTWLPEEQMRFALCYKVVQDLRSYERNKLPVFIDDALKHWSELRPYLRKLFNPLPGPLVEQTYLSSPDLDPETLAEMQQMGFPTQAGYHRFISLFPQVSMLSMSHPWFRLTPETKAIMDGINGISAKIEPRLRKKEELGLVADCIERLSGYLYSLIPGIGGKPINDWGLGRL